MLLATSVPVPMVPVGVRYVLSASFPLLELPLAQIAMSATGLNMKPLGSNIPAVVVLEAMLARPILASTAATSATVVSILNQETGKSVSSVPSVATRSDMVLVEMIHLLAQYAEVSMNS